MNTPCKKVSDVIVPDPEFMFKGFNPNPIEACERNSSLNFREILTKSRS